MLLIGCFWDVFDFVLIRGDKLIGVLIDWEKIFVIIVVWMLEYGYDNYCMIVGEVLGNGEEEFVCIFFLEEVF